MANLIIDVAFWGSIGFCFSYILGWDYVNLIKIIIPYLWGYRWFVTAYIVLLLLIPFINKSLHNIGKDGHRMLLIIFTLLFCVWPSFLPSPPIDDFGYGFVHFVYLYLISSYIRLYGIDNIRSFRSSMYLILYIVFTLFVYIIVHFNVTNTGWAYNNLFVVLQAVSLFMCFLRIRIDSRTINFLASCTFGVFLIHTDGFFGKLIYGNLFQAPKAMMTCDYVYMSITFIICIMVFYLFACALESMKQILFRYTLDRLLSRIMFFNKVISI